MGVEEGLLEGRENIARFQRVAAGAGVCVGGWGLIGFLGWVFGLEAVGVWGSALMRPNTGALFVLLGASLFLQSRPPTPRAKLLAEILALAVFLVGFLTLLERSALFSLASIPIPKQMASGTALNFALLGWGLLGLRALRPGLYLASVVVVSFALLSAFVAFAGYWFGVAGSTTMSIHAAVGFIALSFGMFFSRPQHGVIAILAQSGSAGFTVRRLLPVVIVLPLVLGWLQLEGEQAGLYDAAFGIALMATASALILAALVLWNAYSQGRADEERQLLLRDELFLFDLGEVLQPLTDPGDALSRVTGMLGSYLGVSNSFLIEVNEGAQSIAIVQEHQASGFGPMPLSLLNHELLEASRAGRTSAIKDLLLDPRTAEMYEKMASLVGIRAVVAVPLLRDGQWVSMLIVSKDAPHTWQTREIGLAQVVAEKAWVWFEHLRRGKALQEREQALMESEARYRDLYENSPDMYFSVDSAGLITDCNRTLLLTLGFSRALIGQPLLTLYNEDSVALVKSSFAAFLKSGIVRDVERTMQRKDGKLLLVNLTANGVYNEEGVLIGGRVVARDISRRRHLEKMQERDRLFHLSQDMVGISKGGYFTQLNPAFEETLGYSSEELLSRPFVEFIHPDDRPSNAQGVQTQDASPSAPLTRFTNRYQCKDGSYRWLQWRVAPDSDGAWYAIARDITKDKELEETLRLNEERFRLLIEGVKDYAICMLDPEGKISTWNEGAERLKGYQTSEILGQHFSIFHELSSCERGHPEEELALSKAEGRYEEEGWRVRKDGSRFWANVVMSPLRSLDGEIRGFAKVTRDFSERRRAEQALQRQQADLTSSLKEREVLLQEVHHRVKNNLQIVSSLINMQLRQLTDTSSRSALAECKARIEAIALIHERLYQSKNYANIQFSSYLKNLTDNIFFAAGLSGRLQLKVELENISLSVDRAIPCGLILNELITNAVKHAFPAEPGTLFVGLRTLNERELILIVSDDGVGLSPAFELESSNSLGMMLVTTLVEQLDGRLEIIRARGTEFRIIFPSVEH